MKLTGLSNKKHYNASPGMRPQTLSLVLILVITWTSASAHKDRIEKPTMCRFTMSDNQIITFDNTGSKAFTTFCDEVVKGKRKLLKAEFTFDTGETLTCENNGYQWTKISMSDGKTEVTVPDSTTEKIPVIHLQSVALLWDSRDEKAFVACYFYIEFAVDMKKSHGEYPELRISFSEKKFVGVTILRQVSRNTTRWSDF